MIDTYLKLIVLYCLQKINGQRSIYSIFHLLKGKKSAQTIQDAHFFQLTNLFYTFPNLQRTVLEDIVSSLTDEGIVKQDAEQSYSLTSKGEKLLQHSLTDQSIPNSLNGLKFHQILDLFWERLSLTIQVISHLKSRDTMYLPIQRKKEAHFWVKNFLQQTALNRDELGKKLYMELVQCLEGNKELNPSLLVLRLTGYKKIGLTPLQAAETLTIEYDKYHIQFISLLHYMLENIQTNQKDYPLLSMFISHEQQSFSLTQSAHKTFSLLKKGIMIEEIVSIRRLKRNTIEDHIVEIALNIKEFDISSFVSVNKQKLIIEAFQRSSSKQLKYIRQLVPSADYFEIRLTLSRAGEQNET
ncbi:helix-turn-helix domain-containing protein [Bacillus sp. S/N-304-OC-R1]|uniref:helix-turn-helix domain-containing protein n=1 Tax=Bacillus sp. S/N-304-OC-R1 TaxID=2758034 RepID=UPI001C8D3C63|nr:helix-turn-helix domain-containing protein [Bacillus sp. S/N-304-OC-R1]MBY0122552.1 helix-turn-helix domain-containing protein [Bacillus sp. S/N-304-OC-R1]